LTKDEKIEWKAYVNRMSADWFSVETWPVLADLCRAVVLSRYFAARLREVTADIKGLETRIREENPDIETKDFKAAIELRLDRVDKAARLQLEQAKQVGSLSTKLRLTPQSRYQPNTAGQKTRDEPKRRPWEREPSVD
jgi:hypothetical protein